MLTRRVKVGLVSGGILTGCLALALLIVVLSAEREALRRVVEVTSSRELAGGRLLVTLAPERGPARRVAVEAITRYPFGFAVVEPGGDGQPLRPPARPVAVRTVRLAPGPVQRTVVAFGTVAAARDAEVAARVDGQVAEVLVELGQRVEAGAPLVRLDPSDRALALRRAEAEEARAAAARRRTERDLASLDEQLAIAVDTLATRERERDRWAALAAQGIATPERADQAAEAWRAARATRVQLAGSRAALEAALAEADAALALAQAAREQVALELERCTVRAPFAGAVAERRVDPGAFLRAGAAVVRLVSAGELRLRVHVREDEAAALAPGAAATLSIPGADLPRPAGLNGRTPAGYGGLTGRVVGVSAAADPRTRKVAVEVAVAGPLEVMRAGLFARVELDAGRVAEAHLIPDEAVVADERGYHVFVAEDDVVRRRPVELGWRQGEARLLRAGLTGEVELVREGSALLFDGAPIARLDAPAPAQAAAPADAAGD